MARGISPRGPGKPAAVPSPGGTSRVGPSGAAPKPRLKNTRDYGKREPGAVTPPPISPFGPGDSTGRLGGI